MRKLNYYGIALLPLMLASCGGNFGVQPVVESTPTAYPVTFKSKDVPTSPPAKPSIRNTPVNQPAVGAAMRLPRRNIATFDKNGNEIPDSKQAEEYLPLKEEDILFLDGTPQEQADKLKKKINERYPDVKVITSTNEDAKYNYRFVRAGYVFTRGEDTIMKKKRLLMVRSLLTDLVMTVLYIIQENIRLNPCRVLKPCNIPVIGSLLPMPSVGGHKMMVAV